MLLCGICLYVAFRMLAHHTALTYVASYVAACTGRRTGLANRSIRELSFSAHRKFVRHTYIRIADMD